MQILDVVVEQDHIDSISRAKKPILGLAELIWNSVDADATAVKVQLNRTALNAIDTIHVIDNGQTSRMRLRFAAMRFESLAF